MADITIYHLEMTSPGQLQSCTDARGLQVSECEIPQYLVNKFLYQLVGQHWAWNERLVWPEARWRDYAERRELRTWLALHQGSPAGYYELETQLCNAVEIKYFGLAQPFIGKGLGGYLLSHALRSAWDWGDTQRVYVQTCTLDHPGALSNYQARGMQLFKTEVESA